MQDQSKQNNNILSPEDLIEQWSHFLISFPNTVTTYIHDYGAKEQYPVKHSKQLPNALILKNGYGCFYSVNGFASGRRVITDLTSLNSFYVDIDYPVDAHLPIQKSVLDEIRNFKREVFQALLGDVADPANVLPTFIVETKRGYQALWVFHEPILIEQLASPEALRDLIAEYTRIQTAIIRRYQGDEACKDIARVLRMPGCLHRKNPSAPFMCKLVYENTEEKYTYQQLKTFFLSHENESVYDARFNDLIDTAKEMQEKNQKRIFTEASPNDISKDVLEQLNKDFPIEDRPSTISLCRKTGIIEGERNNSLFIASSLLRKAGKTQAEVESNFADGYNGLTVYEIRSTISSAFKRPETADFGWEHPIVQKHVSEEEKVKVKGLISVIMDRERKKKIKKSQAENTETVDEEDDGEKEKQKAIRAKMFDDYEKIIHERYPNIKYATNTGFYEYVNGIYVPRTIEDIETIIVNEMSKDKMSKEKTVSKVKSKLLCFRSLQDIRVDIEELDKNKTSIVINNGILSLRDLGVTPWSPDHFSLNKINVTFTVMSEGEPKCPRFLQFIREITDGDPGKARLLQQIAGYLLTKNTKYEKMFIFYGGGQNGKSVFMRTLQYVLGEDNVSNVEVEDLDDHAQLLTLHGKRANLMEEVSLNHFESNTLKSLISGNPITVKRKYMPSITFTPYAKFCLAVDRLPRIRDTSIALYRRIIIIPFTVQFKQPDVNLDKKLQAEKDGIFEWMLRGLVDLTSNKGFAETEDTNAMLDSFKQNNSPLLEFIRREYIWITDEDENKREASKIDAYDVYKSYSSYCMTSGYQRKSYSQFISEIETIEKVEKTIHIDVKKELIYGLRDKRSPLTQTAFSAPFTF